MIFVIFFCFALIAFIIYGIKKLAKHYTEIEKTRLEIIEKNKKQNQAWEDGSMFRNMDSSVKESMEFLSKKVKENTEIKSAKLDMTKVLSNKKEWNKGLKKAVAEVNKKDSRMIKRGGKKK